MKPQPNSQINLQLTPPTSLAIIEYSDKEDQSTEDTTNKMKGEGFEAYLATPINQAPPIPSN
jgi:hypothetical protein